MKARWQALIERKHSRVLEGHCPTKMAEALDAFPSEVDYRQGYGSILPKS